MKLKKLQHVGMIVQDMDRMLPFYENLLGLKAEFVTPLSGEELARQTKLANPQIKVAFIELKNGAIEFIQYLQPMGQKAVTHVNTPGAMHICFEVDDIEEAAAYITDKGIRLHDKPVTFPKDKGPMAGYKMAYFNDPEGNLLEIMETP